MAADKDVLSNMFSSFVSRKTRACSPVPPAPLSPQALALSSPSSLPLLPQMSRLSSRLGHPSQHQNYNNHHRYHCETAITNQIPNSFDDPYRLLQPATTAATTTAVETPLTSHFGLHDSTQLQAPRATRSMCGSRPRDETRDRDSRIIPAAKNARHTRSRSSYVSTSRESPLRNKQAVVEETALRHIVQDSEPTGTRKSDQSRSQSRSRSRSQTGSGDGNQNGSRNQFGRAESLSVPMCVSVHNETTGPNTNMEQYGSERGGAGSSSVHGGRGSGGSVEAIATDSTAVATPFHCDKCSKAFRQRSQLSRHFLRVHERQKPFGCAHCDKCFASAFDRKRHVEAVHGRRCIEFFCDRCSFRSKQESELDEHIRSIHERDQCRLCGKMFKRAANLVAHERHYHSKTA